MSRTLSPKTLSRTTNRCKPHSPAGFPPNESPVVGSQRNPTASAKTVLRWRRDAWMKRILLYLIVAAVLLIAFLIYRSRPRTHLNVTPDAQREIEKAKRR